MRDFRVAVGVSLKGKVEEHGFFLRQIVDTIMVIEKRLETQDYPINAELNRLNYFFSAYLNTIQSLKDACQTALGVNVSWRSLSPSYGDFIYYCRNSATHDGYHLINCGSGIKNYIAGPLRRIDNRGKVIEFNPPREDVLSLCLNVSAEVLVGIRSLLQREGCNIPIAEEDDLRHGMEALLMSDFIPDEIKRIAQTNRDSIEFSFKGVRMEIVPQIFGAIDFVDGFIADARAQQSGPPGR